ncbi:MAG: S41 family peptidase, partial [Acidobacteriota bacterium]
MTDSPWRLRRIALAWSLIASCTVSAAAAQDKPASGARRAASEARSGAEPMEGSFAATLAIIEKNSLKKVARRRLMESAVNGMLHDLDPYSRYLGPEEWRRLNTALAGKFGGIGVFLDIDAAARRLRVKYLLAGSSGAEAGMAAGDQILEINGRSTKDLPLDQVLEVLPGPVGSEVRLLVLHPGAAEPVRLAVERRTVKTPSVRAGHRDDQGRWDYLEDPAHGIGYMRILRLAEDTVDDMKAALTVLESRNLRGLILDLRENTGGLTAAAIAAADLFLDSGRILTVTDADGKESFYDARPGSYTAF